MKCFPLLVLAAFAALGQAQAAQSTSVSCLLKTRVAEVSDQPFMHVMARVEVLEVADDTWKRNDFPCTQQFRVGQWLWVDVSPPVIYAAYRTAAGDRLPFHFVYRVDSAGRITRQYVVILPDEFEKRRKK